VYTNYLHRVNSVSTGVYLLFTSC